MGDRDWLFLRCSGGWIEVVVWRWIALDGGCLNSFCDLEGYGGRHFEELVF